MSLLGIDIGTSGCKAAVFSDDGIRLSFAYREYAALYPFQGGVELNSMVVWNKVKEIIKETVSQTSHDPVSALCVSSMGEAATPVTKDRNILANCILSSDIRGQDYINAFPVSQREFYQINPNILAGCYTLPKLQWLKEKKPELYNKTDKFVLWDGLPGFLLGCEPFITFSEANRTLLFDIRQEDWSEELLDITGISGDKLPRCVEAGTIVGQVNKTLAGETGLMPGVSIIAGGHDQCCNALGAGVHHPGEAVDGIGTYECITPVYDHLPESGKMLSVGLNVEHHVLPGLYVSFLFNQAGSLIRWFIDTFVKERKSEPDIIEKIALEMPEGPTGLFVLPCFEPTGSPYFISDASGVILGLKTSTSRGQVLKAIMESITFYFAETIDALKKIGINTTGYIATGGGSNSDAWLQIKADIMGIPYLKPSSTESGVTGAAILAGLATGKFRSAEEAVQAFISIEKKFEPRISMYNIYQDYLEEYCKLMPLIHGYLSDVDRINKKHL